MPLLHSILANETSPSYLLSLSTSKGVLQKKFAKHLRHSQSWWESGRWRLHRTNALRWQTRHKKT